jgi:hypothetical protein
MRLFLDRFIRAARLDVELYKEVVADPLTLNQAWITVLIYCMAASWGSFGGVGAIGTNVAMITTLIGWYIWAFFTYFAATRFFRESQTEVERVDRKSVIRAMGFASAPVCFVYWVLYRVWALSFCGRYSLDACFLNDRRKAGLKF